MRRIPLMVAVIAALGLALAPSVADARAGDGASMGSRGSHTWTAPPRTNTAPNSAQPLQRSLTPRGQPNYGAAAPAPGYGYRSGFGSGLLGGILGVGLGSLLFGHVFGGGAFGLFGFLIRVLILFFIVRWLIRLFRGNTPALAGGPGLFGFGRSFETSAGPRPMPGGGAPPPVAISPSDYQAFEQALHSVQDAWSRHDIATLRDLATPEMVSYFAEQLADQASRGVRNTVSDVRLVQGDLAQSWTEQGRDYASVAMRFSMVDVTRDATGRIVDGSPTEHTSATELWTFVRTRGGRWLLSAIQQAR